MELAAKYAYAVYEKKSFSLAAKELFISQPALSAMVAKLERELGFQLFERTKGSAVTLTQRGRIYMDMLEEIHFSEKTMKKRLEQYDRAPANRLSIGGMMYMAYFLMPEVFRRFHDSCPEVMLEINMGTVGFHGVLHDKLENGALDLLLSYRVDERFESLPLLNERYLIAMRRDMPGAAALESYALTRDQVLQRHYTETQKISDLSLFAPIAFIPTGEVSQLRSELSGLLGSHHGFSQVSVLDSRYLGMYYSLMKKGLGAAVAVDMHLHDPLFDDDGLMYLLPKTQKPYRTLYLLWKKGEKPSTAAQRLIKILTERCQELSAFGQPSAQS